jgi:glycosyltransferase involved in cell wall biosynthesis
MTIPLVSIMMTTYNHEKYIAQAVESVVSQETDFPYEIIIGEDCSTDNTKEILLNLQKNHSEKVFLRLREENIGRRKNFLDVLNNCRGDFVAILEGDDYWNSPHKLQKQVDFYKNHPDCTICFHSVLKQYEENNEKDRTFRPSPVKDIYTIDDLFEKNFISTCSVMYRNNLITEFPEWIQDIPAADWPLNILIARYGDIGYIDETMAVYRVHPQGVWSPQLKDQKIRNKIKMLETIRHDVNPIYNDKINRSLATMHLKLLYVMAMDKNLNGIFSHLHQIFTNRQIPLLSLVDSSYIILRKRIG